MENFEKLKEQILSLGCQDVGFAFIGDEADKIGFPEFKYAISIVVKLSDAVVDSISDTPTHIYFHHYRTVNTHIDNVLLKIGMELEKLGGKYLPVGASQSISGYSGFFQHKTAARLAGLGSIGKSGLFLSKKFGPRVRLGTLLTNIPLPCDNPCKEDFCGDCDICVKLCPAMAISSKNFDPESPECTVDQRACSEYMKKNFQHIGRGVVCGICMKNCPKGK